MDFDVNALTVGELCDLAEVAGDEAISGLSTGTFTARAVLGLVWILGKRDNPGYTLEEARTVRVSEVTLDANAATPAPAAETNGATPTPEPEPEPEPAVAPV